MGRLFHVKHFGIVLLGSMLLLGTGCVSVEKSLITGNKRAYGYTWTQERQIGQEADAAIAAQYGLYDDPDLAAYVDRIGQEVLQYSHLHRPETPAEMKNTPFTFRLLDSPVVNAFALPGGYVYVTRGLLAHLDNEAQLAVVLGHEIGHVVGRHASKRAATQALGQGLLLLGAVGGQAVLGGTAGESILNVGSQATQLLFLSYGRDDERESDDVGVEYAAKAGYMAGEGAAFFTSLKRLGEQSGGSIPTFMSTHPDPGEREQTILRHAREWAASTNMTKVNGDVYLSRIDGMVLGEDPRQGYTEGGRFYHPGLRFQFPVPSGYQVINQPSQVVMVEGNQQAIMVLTLEANAQNVEAAAQTFAAQEGLTVIERGPARSSGGLSAQVVVADAQTQDGQTVRVMAYFIAHGGNVYRILGYSAAQTFSSHSGAFSETMQGFAPLNDSRYLHVQPERLQVIQASRTASFRSFVTTLPRGMSLEELAILNQVGTDETIQAGEKLKLVR